MSFDPLSQTSYYLESFYESKSILSGTGFFVLRKGYCYLVTNGHNVTNRNPNDNSYLQYAVDPDKLIVQIFKNQENLEPINLEIKLLDSGNKLWLEHPTFGLKVDVIAIQVEIPENMSVFEVERFIEPFNEETKSKVKDDVFILGYPFGISSGEIFPIWKRASIASEPIIDIDGMPKMYVDTASRPGMSGSPVIYKEKRQFGIGDAAPGVPGAKFSNNLMGFIGVYSGRIGSDNEKLAQLGIVWKYSVIDEIINK